MKVRASVVLEIDPFEFDKTCDEVSYPEIAYILANYPGIYDVDEFEIEADRLDDDYEEMLADEARREQDWQVRNLGGYDG